jgi:hypothetical protein
MKGHRMNHYRILVVGAGLAGLSLARALRQAGLAPQVIEREPGWGVAGTGIYLPANGVRALRTLGLEGRCGRPWDPDPPSAPPRPPRAPARRDRPASAVGERRSLPGPAPDRAAPDSPRGRAGAVGPHHPVAGEPRRARPGRLRRRQWWRLRLGRRGRWAALLGPAAGRRPTAAGPRRPAQLAVPGRLPTRGHDLDGHARPGHLLPDRPGRPGVGVRLCRRDPPTASRSATR